MSNDIRFIAGNILGTIVVIYAAFMMIDTFCKTTPDFCGYGWSMFIALLAGVVFYFKYVVFR